MLLALITLPDFLSPTNVASLFAMVAGAVGAFAWFTGRRKKLIALASYYAFHIVEDVGAEIDGDDGFDKSARFLKELDAYMVVNGWRPLKPGDEVDLAKMNASALHGVEVAKAKVAEAALTAVGGAASDALPTPPMRPPR